MKENIDNRLIWIDVIRTLAIFFVILCHSTETVYQLNLEGMETVTLPSKFFCFLFFTIGRLGVPLFLFITGYLLLSRQYDNASIVSFWKKSCFRLFIIIQFWILLYHIFLLLWMNKNVTIMSLLKEMLFLEQLPLGHMWYMPMILGMYLFFPVMSNGFLKIDFKLYIVPIIIFLFYSFIVPTFNIILMIIGKPPLTATFSSGFSGGAYGIYILSGLAIKNRLFYKIHNYLWGGVLGVSLLLTVYLQLFSYKSGIPYNVWYDCITLIISSTAICELFSRIKVIKFEKLFKKLSTYSFAIYLVHYPVLLILLEKLRYYSAPIKVIVLWLLTLITSFIISLVISKIPFIGRKILYIY